MPHTAEQLKAKLKAELPTRLAELADHVEKANEEKNGPDISRAAITALRARCEERQVLTKLLGSLFGALN